MKKIVTGLLILIIMISSFSVMASAQTGFFLGKNSYSYNGNTYCTCKLKKPGKTNASVKVSLTSTGPLTIRMTDENGRYIWGEDYCIRPNSWNRGTRTFKLGKDHAVYRLYFKSTNGKGTGFCSVSNAKNCTIS